jgi:hypothetical protein
VGLRKHGDKSSDSLKQAENSRPDEQSSTAEEESISLSWLVCNKDVIINRTHLPCYVAWSDTGNRNLSKYVEYFCTKKTKKTKLRGRSPQAYYTDRATAAFRRS